MSTYRITIKLKVKPNKKKRVAIIGSGPAGLVAAKTALESGLTPVIFDRKRTPGGLWAAGTAIWDNMHTNVSRYSVSFSDFPWPANSSIIPSAKDVFNYLLRYIYHFDLEKYLCLSSNVESVRQLPNKKWQVTWTNYLSGERITEVFDFLICSTGLHCKPNMPKIKNADKFDGLLLHSADFKSNDERLKNKRVVVVGNSYSGVEIASNLVGHCKSVVNVFKRPYLVYPRLLKFQVERNMFKILPIDMLFSRELTYEPRTLEERRKLKIDLYKSLCPHQTDKTRAHPAMYYELNDDEPIREAVTDNYYPYINTGKIKPRKTSIKYFDSQGLRLEDGGYEPADVVIFCTGYRLCMDYFDQSVLKTMKFDQNNESTPIILYKHTVHPDLENLAMIGEINGLFFAGFEMQSRWVMQLFKGERKLPERARMDEEMREEEMLRDGKHKEKYYPHGFYRKLIDKLAFECDCLPNFEHIFNTDADLHRMLWCNGTIPVHFCFNQNRELSIRVMKEVDEIIQRVYYFNDDEIKNLTTTKLAQKFSQYYKIPMHLFKDKD